MTKKELIIKIKEEYQAGLEFECLDNGNSFTMMFDISDGDFWIDGLTQGTWKVYHNPDIIQVPPYIPYNAPNGYTLDERVDRILNWCINHVCDGVITD